MKSQLRFVWNFQNLSAKFRIQWEFQLLFSAILEIYGIQLVFFEFLVIACEFHILSKKFYLSFIFKKQQNILFKQILAYDFTSTFIQIISLEREFQSCRDYFNTSQFSKSSRSLPYLLLFYYTTHSMYIIFKKNNSIVWKYTAVLCFSLWFLRQTCGNINLYLDNCELHQNVGKSHKIL